MTDTQQTEAINVVEAYHRAWTSGDVDAALELVDDDLVCTAPDPDVDSRSSWREYLRAFAPMLTGTPELARMVDGDRVALWYYPQTEQARHVLASELFTVRDGRIAEIRLSFDRLGYAPPEGA